MEEIWKDIQGFWWKYKISNLWKVKSIQYKRWNKIKILSNTIDNQWYSRIWIYSWKLKTFLVHRLVAIHFIPNPNNLPYVLHKDETLNENWALYNWKDNLFWGTAKDNAQDRQNKWRWKWYLSWKNNPLSKCVSQYSFDWRFIKEWESISIAGKWLWIASNSISSCCLSKRKSAGGFIWKFKN